MRRPIQLPPDRRVQAYFSLRRSIKPTRRTAGDLKRTSVERIAVQIPLPRLDETRSPSARTSKGFSPVRQGTYVYLILVQINRRDRVRSRQTLRNILPCKWLRSSNPAIVFRQPSAPTVGGGRMRLRSRCREQPTDLGKADSRCPIRNSFLAIICEIPFAKLSPTAILACFYQASLAAISPS